LRIFVLGDNKIAEYPSAGARTAASADDMLATVDGISPFGNGFFTVVWPAIPVLVIPTPLKFKSAERPNCLA
jgi:hypothetical protein